jgi:hypothetical protein
LEASTAQFDKESIYQNINENLTRPTEEEDDGILSQEAGF